MSGEITGHLIESNRTNYRYYDVIAVIFVAVLLASNVTTSKIIRLGGLDLSAAVVLFPISYIFGDILTEVYGYVRSRRIIWLGFVCAAGASALYWLVGVLPPAPGWENQDAYLKILGVVPRIVAAGLAAYWAGEFVNSFVLARMKVLTKGRHLWSRTIGSTIVGQAVDTVVFVGLAFYGVLPEQLLLSVAFNVYWVKVLYEILATPVTYAIVTMLKRVEGMDVFDRDTNFNPFRLGATSKS